MDSSGGSSPANAPPLPVAVLLPITLGQFVKTAGLVVTGGEAKQLIAAGLVKVNGVVEKRRGHKLAVDDVVDVRGVLAAVAVKQVTGPQG